MEQISVLSAFPVSISVAFILGFLARQVNLPPLVGFLAAGFLLHAVGFQTDDAVATIADLGVTLLLFTIGLKLKVKNLVQTEVWAGASIHAIITVIVFALIFKVLGAAGATLFGFNLSTALILAFALSFSSTVFAVKILEDKGEMLSLHGRTAIGILIMQDIFAVLFLTASTGNLPSPWALALLGFILLRPALFYILDRCGHGELLPMFGLFSALALGVALFKIVGLKADLGALLLGMLLADHQRASEIAETLFGFKELFLVGFFLQIGLSGAPTLGDFGIAMLLVGLLPLKAGLFFLLLTRLRLRARSSFLATIALANYSEFGLIVGAIGVANGWLDSSWLLIIAIALSISFVLISPFNQAAHRLYASLCPRLRWFECECRHPEDQPIDPGDAKVAIFGMGRIGTGAYDYIRERFGDIAIGIETDREKVLAHQRQGRRVIQGDATDSDFWARKKHGRMRLVMLAMPEHHSNMYAMEQLRAAGFSGYVAALAQFADQQKIMEEAGAHVAFNLYEGAGAGFAAHVEKQLGELAGVAAGK
jgi:glutathione-regulated potassium-efflux system ancillary protein KefC